MDKISFYQFWNPQSGFCGGVLFGGIILLYFLCIAALVKYLLF